MNVQEKYIFHTSKLTSLILHKIRDIPQDIEEECLYFVLRTKSHSLFFVCVGP